MSNWIICPVRNGCKLTQRAHQTFLSQDIGDVRVLYIDNGSTDGTGPWLWTTEASTMRFDPGRSVAASWNTALRWLFEGHPLYSKTSPRVEYVLVVNNDVELLPETYRLLVADGGEFVTAVGVRKWPQNIRLEASATRPHPDFSCFLIRRSCWLQVGLFDERYQGAYAEDADYHVRMHRLGIDAHCIDIPFLHHAAQTLAQADETTAERIRKAADVNRALFRSIYGCDVGSPEYYRDLFGHDAPTEAGAEASPVEVES